MAAPALHMLMASGAASAFDPLSIAGCQLWLDADDAAQFTYSSGVVVSQWSDKSSAARHATQGTAASQPSRNGSQNGRTTVTFDGGDRLNFTAFTSGTGLPMTVFLVGKKNAVSNATCALHDPAVGESWIAFDPSSSTGAPYSNHGTPGGAASAPANLATGTYGLVTAKHTGGTTGAYAVALNASFGTAKNVSVSIAWSAIGYYPSFQLNGAIAELLIYDTALGTTDLANVHAYLNTKWALY